MGACWGAFTQSRFRSGQKSQLQISTRKQFSLFTVSFDYMQITEADVMLLTKIFPDASLSHVWDMCINAGLSLDKVVEVLLSKKPAAVVPTTQMLLDNLASQVIDFDNDITIIVNRNVLYNKAKVWYKCAMADPSIG